MWGCIVSSVACVLKVIEGCVVHGTIGVGAVEVFAGAARDGCIVECLGFGR